LALQGKDITVYSPGSQKRNVIYVEDAVDAIISASQKDGIGGETFFAVGDQHYSVSEIAEDTVKYIGSGKVRFIDWPKDRKVAEFGDAIISNKKIKETLNWAPRWSHKDGLLKTKEYYANCLKKYL
jgi:UDP-glucose 4-epimerase